MSVAVGDTGPGIAPQEEERIFRPFWSGDGGGTGLGLTIYTLSLHDALPI